MGMQPQAPGQGESAGEQAAEGGQQPQGSNQFGELVTNLTNGMAMLSETVAAVNPDAGSQLDKISQAFQGVIKQLISAGGDPSAAPAGAGMANAQAGVGKAVPAGPQGVARG